MDIYMKFSRFRKVKKERQVNAFQMSADPPGVALDRASAVRSAVQNYNIFASYQKLTEKYIISPLFSRGESPRLAMMVSSLTFSAAHFPMTLRSLATLATLRALSDES